MNSVMDTTRLAEKRALIRKQNELFKEIEQNERKQ